MAQSMDTKLVVYCLRLEILVLKMDKMNVSITKISLYTTISRTSIFGWREYYLKVEGGAFPTR